MVGTIEDYGLIGDLQTAALVGRDGSIDWLCLPRFDSPACFAALLDDDRRRPLAAGARRRRQPAPGAGTAGTPWCSRREWETAGRDGAGRRPDATPRRGARRRPDRRGRVRPGADAHRSCGSASTTARSLPWVRHGRRRVGGGGRSGRRLVRRPRCRWTTATRCSRPRSRWRPATACPSSSPTRPRTAGGPGRWTRTRPCDQTLDFWSDWMDHCRYEGRWSDAVRRSLVTLKALTYAPTGGIVAAATTSLPEELGGSRNWDYRYCWLRDATFTLQALLGTGYVREARAWRDWLLRAVAGDPADLRIMYALDGSRRIPEYELPVAVRVRGLLPGAGRQRRGRRSSSSTCGARSSTACTSAGRPGCPAPPTRGTCSGRCWTSSRAPGTGRTTACGRSAGPQRPFVHSKVMAWAGVDRAVQAVERFGLDGPVDRWRRLRQEIHDDVCAQGLRRRPEHLHPVLRLPRAWTPHCC